MGCAVNRMSWVRGGMSMRGFVFAAIFAVVSCVSQNVAAADLLTEETTHYEVLPVIWSGFYFGGHLGGASTDTDIKDVFDYNGDPEANNSLSSTSMIAGIQLGYNFQDGGFVYGLEADLGTLNLSASKTVGLPNPTGHHNNDIGTTYAIDGDLYGDLTARIGYAEESALFYLKGGAAFLNADFNANYVGQNCTTKPKNPCGAADPATFDFGHSDTLWGWTAGVGVEYALSSAWSVKLEYQHFDFGSMSYDYGGEYKFKKFNGRSLTSTLEGETEISPTVDVVKIGVNYQFGRDGDGLD